ncbi:MAG TPA: MBL fold metallo-hydrolase [Acetobacteraceae bacterium]|nr:MBL fold metallo-hydrolase [Acetobacteraceae bacterium]
MTALRVTMLGCGGSGGVPLIGGNDGLGIWGACDPGESGNRRTRSSIVIESADGRRLLVDAGPDLRAQMLENRLGTVDAVLFTHAHADHVLGVDDLRQVNRNRDGALDAFADLATLEVLQRRFDYAFRPATQGFFRPALVPRTVAPGETHMMAGMEVRILGQDHKVMQTLGLRIGRFAYCTDVVAFPPESLAALEGLDTWIVGCFGRRPHPVHAHVDLVLEWAGRLRPRRTVLTHMGIDMDWAWLQGRLPDGVEAGRDGLVMEVPA